MGLRGCAGGTHRQLARGDQRFEALATGVTFEVIDRHSLRISRRSQESNPYPASTHVGWMGRNRPNGLYRESHGLPIFDICTSVGRTTGGCVGPIGVRDPHGGESRGCQRAEVSVSRTWCAARQRGARPGRRRALGRHGSPARRRRDPPWLEPSSGAINDGSSRS